MTEENFEKIYENFIKLHNNEGPFSEEFVINVRDIVAGGSLLTQSYIDDETRTKLHQATPDTVYEAYCALFKNVLRNGTISTYGPIGEE